MAARQQAFAATATQHASLSDFHMLVVYVLLRQSDGRVMMQSVDE
jgi:hypothetical protein